MKKTVLAVALACVNIGVSFAGTMGPTNTQLNTQLRPFVSGEGAYTWNQLKTISVNGFSSENTKNQWGGRLGAGFYRPLSEQFSFITEAGFGYYGKVKRNIVAAGLSLDTTIYGLDLLVGASYHLPMLDIFVKGGGMFENETVQSYSDLSKLYTGNLMHGESDVTISKLQLLPEIKVGVLHDVTEQLGLTLSYMHVFGAIDSSNLFLSANPGSFALNQSSNASNVTLDSIMFGVQYTFA